MQPFCLKPTDTVADMMAIRKVHGYKDAPVTVTGTVGSQLLGKLLTIRQNNSMR